MKDMLKRIMKVLALFSVSVLCVCYACFCSKTDEGLKNFNLSAGSATIIEGEKIRYYYRSVGRRCDYLGKR